MVITVAFFVIFGLEYKSSTSGMGTNSSAFLLRRHSSPPLASLSRQPNFLVKSYECFVTASGIAHGQKLVPD